MTKILKVGLFYILSRVIVTVFAIQEVYVQEAMVGVVNGLQRKDCVIALIYDDLLEKSLSYKLIQELQNENRQFIILDLTAENLETSVNYKESSDRIAKYLHTLYRQSGCYIFLFWVTNPKVLYPRHINIHPGYRRNDVVIFTAHHVTKNYKRFIQSRFWSEIPNAIGLKNSLDEEERETVINIFTVLPYYKNGTRKSHELDIWNVKKKKFERNVTLVFDKFTSFNNAVLKKAILWKAPFLIWGDLSNPTLDGLDWRLLLLVNKNLNYGHDEKQIRNVWKSGRKRNGNWTGAMGLLQSGEIDMIIGGISANPERLLDFDFCHIYYTDSYIFIAPITTQKADILKIFAKPLHTNVWNSLMISFIVVAVSLKVLAKIEQKFINNKKYHDINFTRFWHNMGYLFRTFCQKPFPHVPTSNSLRCIFMGTSLSITVTGIIFAGSLFSILLNTRTDKYADTLESVLKSELPICIMDYDGHLNSYAETSNKEEYIMIWNIANFTEYFNSFTCIENVVHGNSVYIDSKARLKFAGRYQFEGANGVKFHFGKEELISQVGMGWPTRKNWPFQEKINSILTRAVESGLVNYWMSMFNRGKFGWDKEALDISEYGNMLRPYKNETLKIDPTLTLRNKGGFTHLGVVEFNMVISLWILGILLAILCFIGELITRGTWTIASLIRRFIRWCLSVFKRKWMQKQLLTLQKQLNTRQGENKTEGQKRYNLNIVWEDLTIGVDEYNNQKQNIRPIIYK